jgi:hypothetical protein
MTIKVPLPGNNWAVLRTADDMTLADGDKYTAAVRKAWRDAREAAGGTIPARPDPDNPAQMLPAEEPDVSLSEDALFALRGLGWGMIIQDWSYSAALPYTEESRTALPLSAGPALVAAVGPVVDALSGVGPKEDETSTGSSESSSPDGSASQTEPAST